MTTTASLRLRRKKWAVNSAQKCNGGKGLAEYIIRKRRFETMSKLKPGKNWARAHVLYLDNIIRASRAIRTPEDEMAIRDFWYTIDARKRWKLCTPHHGYLFWKWMR